MDAPVLAGLLRTDPSNGKYVKSELTSESLHESFVNSHVLVKREQELHES